jgi:hydrogenase maturation protease
LILGLGNPILSDDAAGLWLARRVHELLDDPQTDLAEAAVAGFKTVQLLAPYDRAVIIDSMHDSSRVGRVWSLREDDLSEASPPVSHGVNLRTALELARRLSFPVPGEVLIYVMTVEDPYTFGERFTPDVEKALPAAAATIAAELAALSPRPAGSALPATPGCLPPLSR